VHRSYIPRFTEEFVLETLDVKSLHLLGKCNIREVVAFFLDLGFGIVVG
jgi:hypothetical protein